MIEDNLSKENYDPFAPIITSSKFKKEEILEELDHNTTQYKKSSTEDLIVSQDFFLSGSIKLRAISDVQFKMPSRERSKEKLETDSLSNYPIRSISPIPQSSTPKVSEIKRSRSNSPKKPKKHIIKEKMEKNPNSSPNNNSPQKKKLVSKIGALAKSSWESFLFGGLGTSNQSSHQNHQKVESKSYFSKTK